MYLRFTKYFIFLLIGFCVSCTKEEQKPFSFVQLCDTQLGMGGYEHDVNSFDQAITQINELDVDFAVICGDLVNDANDSSYADFQTLTNRFKIPVYLAAGNHDIGNIPNDTTLSYYRKLFGKEYYDFKHKGYSFIVTNTQFWKVHVKNESEKHDVWFKKTLQNKKSLNHPVFVIGHYPLYTKQPDEEEHYFNLPLIKRQQILKLFLQNNVVAYLSGHRHKLLDNDYQNIQLVSGETTSKNFDKRPFGFRKWEVSSDSIKHHFVPLVSSSNALD